VTYENVSPAIFLSRPNRFIAHALLGDEEIIAHVKNTGRCKELLNLSLSLAAVVLGLFCARALKKWAAP
jgi:DNA-binding sugar fermentation-stimulating protein